MSSDCDKCGEHCLDCFCDKIKISDNYLNAFEKKIIANDCVYADTNSYIYIFSLLINFMKQTNEIHGKNCEFFRLTFRPANRLDNAGMSPYVFEMRWGDRDEM